MKDLDVEDTAWSDVLADTFCIVRFRLTVV